MRRRRRTVALAVLFVASGCYSAHERGDVELDGSMLHDAAPSTDAVARDGPLHPRPRPPVEPEPGESCGNELGHGAWPCNEAREAECERWMELAANGWYGHTVCFERFGRTHCANGDHCPAGEDCRCAAGVTCPVGFACVSDTPEGPRWCRRMCAP